MACAPSEDSNQPGHLPSLIRVFTVRMKKPEVLSYPLSAQRSLWSDWADVQADLSLRWAHMPFCWFCHEAAQVGIWGHPRGFGEQGKKGNAFRGTGNKGLKIRGTREHRQFWGTGNIENQYFVFGEQCHFRGYKGTGTTPPPPHTHTPRGEGLVFRLESKS